MAEMIKGHFDKVILTRPGDFKASDLPRARAAFDFSKPEIIEDYRAAIKTALRTASEKRCGLVVLGSLYLIGEVKKELEKTPWN